jgi:hypothetical protein
MVDAPELTVLTAGLAERVKSSKYMVKVSVAVPMPVVVSVPLTVKVKGFGGGAVAEGGGHETVKVLIVGMVG